MDDSKSTLSAEVLETLRKSSEYHKDRLAKLALGINIEHVPETEKTNAKLKNKETPLPKIGAQSYSDKLKDPRWQRIRLEVLERDNFTCQMCGSTTQTLHVHHGYYEYRLNPWEYDKATLHCACEDCHDQADALRRDLQFECAKLPLNSQEILLGVLTDFRTLTQEQQERLADAIEKLTYRLAASASGIEDA